VIEREYDPQASSTRAKTLMTPPTVYVIATSLTDN